MDFYLSEAPRTEVAGGCPLVALGPDAARQSEDVRSSFEEGVKAQLSLIEKLLPNPAVGGDVRGKAMAILSMMVGAVTLSRIAVDRDLASGILKAASDEALLIASATGKNNASISNLQTSTADAADLAKNSGAVA